MAWNERIPDAEIKDKVTKVTVDFAKRFGDHLAKKEDNAIAKVLR